MDLISNLALGFGIAVTPANLFFCLVGTLVGTLIGGVMVFYPEVFPFLALAALGGGGDAGTAALGLAPVDDHRDVGIVGVVRDELVVELIRERLGNDGVDHRS